MKSVYSSLVALVFLSSLLRWRLLILGRHGKIKSTVRTDFRS